MEELSVAFKNSYLHIPESRSYRIMFLRKGFVFLMVDEHTENTAIVPLTDSQIEALLNSVGCVYENIKSERTMEFLDGHLEGLDRTTELEGMPTKLVFLNS